MIELKNVTKSYNKSIKAVDDLTLEIRKGEIFGFLGPNGAGKTTTIKMITGITNADSGEILIDGVNIKTNPLACKKNFGYVPDNPDMFLRLKGIEYLNFMAEIFNVPSSERKKRIEELCDRFEMEGSLSSNIQSYSHGMRQKIVLIGVLIHKPSNWILDEPMTGLDPKSSHVLKQMMKEHTSEDKSVFFSTHVLEVAEKLCDRVGIINKGKLLFCGTYDEIKAKFNEEASLENIFLEITDDDK
ncbi:MAG: ABC transporter ATP-binding protein [Oscillospiraceae bacterium]|nr:ABC transporter ATP-binding protein [Oscillospiraceae bacterium]